MASARARDPQAVGQTPGNLLDSLRVWRHLAVEVALKGRRGRPRGRRRRRRRSIRAARGQRAGCEAAPRSGRARCRWGGRGAAARTAPEDVDDMPPASRRVGSARPADFPRIHRTIQLREGCSPAASRRRRTPRGRKCLGLPSPVPARRAPDGLAPRVSRCQSRRCLDYLVSDYLASASNHAHGTDEENDA